MSTRISRQGAVMRKAPRQERSRATVELIIEAGARVLGETGWAGFTTNKVAALAGVSIGSLYQYFPDKMSLTDAIRGRHLDDCLAVMRQTKADGLSAEHFAEKLVYDMIAAHSGHPRLHRALLDEAPSSDEHRNPKSAFESEYLGYYVSAVSIYRGRQANAQDRTIALVISDAIDGVIHNAARRGVLDDKTMQRELIRLISLYIADMASARDGS
ncbi:TetR/AcrR family transcriptional regulator [uncultured Devosia sp.]|uniref:TetR/AcrR family transcriptional regulator n=1 Tax=uncultured Devosia sp. TaxID=211434 RepID=UPI0035CA4D91